MLVKRIGYSWLFGGIKVNANNVKFLFTLLGLKKPIFQGEKHSEKIFQDKNLLLKSSVDMKDIIYFYLFFIIINVQIHLSVKLKENDLQQCNWGKRYKWKY